MCPFNVRFAEESAEPGYAARGLGERPVGVEALSGERGVEAERRAATVVTAETAMAEGPGAPRRAAPWHPGTAPPLVELMRMTREDWDAFSRGSAIRRAGYVGFKRNLAVAMGNWLAGLEGEPPEEAVPALRAALEDEEPVVREHAAWALGCADT